jgi:hypothetical protein
MSADKVSSILGNTWKLEPRALATLEVITDQVLKVNCLVQKVIMRRNQLDRMSIVSLGLREQPLTEAFLSMEAIRVDLDQLVSELKAKCNLLDFLRRKYCEG